MDNRLKKFIEEHQDMINSDNYDQLYNDIRIYGSDSIINELTHLLYRAGIDPLKYLTYLPSFFIADEDIDKISLPDNIGYIHSKAFFNCNIGTIEMKSSVVEIERHAFRGCTIGTLYLSGDDMVSPYAFEDVDNIDEIIIDTDEVFDNWYKGGKDNFLNEYGIAMNTQIYTRGDLENEQQ